MVLTERHADLSDVATSHFYILPHYGFHELEQVVPYRESGRRARDQSDLGALVQDGNIRTWQISGYIGGENDISEIDVDVLSPGEVRDVGVDANRDLCILPRSTYRQVL